MNFGRLDGVSLQHEYGIFGGEAGANVLTLVRDLHRPFVVTCHTVLEEPSRAQREVLAEIAARASRVVVMNERAFAFLEHRYGVPREKTALIPHGVHDVPFVDPNYYGDELGVAGRRVLLTAGLRSRNKGIEHVIEALPAIVALHPKVTYVVLGATHPAVLRDEGESYRLELQRRVRTLGLEGHVLFHPRFVEIDTLLEYIGAADIFLTPYLNMDQITSGALTYAMGSGKASVSTPFFHAVELLADGRGRLVPPRDSAAIAKVVSELLGDEVALSAMRKKAYLYCRSMIWPVVAGAYMKLFDEVRSRAPATVPMGAGVARPISPSNIPQPRLDHLLALSDDTGLAHHARRAVPDWRYGYHLEDAAAGLVAATRFHATFASKGAEALAGRCFALVQYLVTGPDGPSEGLDYARNRLGAASDVALGKAAWAVGYAVSHGKSMLAEAAYDIFDDLMRAAPFRDARATAYATLGAANYLERYPGASGIRRALTACAGLLSDATATEGWQERWQSDDHGVAAQALAVASSALGRGDLLERATALAAGLLEETREGTLFTKPGENPDEEESAASATAFIEALSALHHARPDPALLRPIRAAADWFLGANRRGEALYDFATGGCYDALSASGLNRNQGTEATTACLIAMLTLNELAGAQAAPPPRA